LTIGTDPACKCIEECSDTGYDKLWGKWLRFRQAFVSFGKREWADYIKSCRWNGSGFSRSPKRDWYCCANSKSYRPIQRKKAGPEPRLS